VDTAVQGVPQLAAWSFTAHEQQSFVDNLEHLALTWAVRPPAPDSVADLDVISGLGVGPDIARIPTTAARLHHQSQTRGPGFSFHACGAKPCGIPLAVSTASGWLSRNSRHSRQVPNGSWSFVRGSGRVPALT